MDLTFNDVNYKRCIGCKLLRPISEYATKRVKVCFKCRGLERKPDGRIIELAPYKPQPKPRANAAPYPLDNYPAYLRYMRERARTRYAAKREEAGKPPPKPRFPSPFRKCRHCKQTMPRRHFPENSRICKPCLDRELEQINAYTPE
jgi:hypothetical protein